MAYKHGTYGEFAKSMGAVPVTSATTPVYIGTAPINLVRSYATKGLLNKPIKINNLSEAYDKLGYSSDWANFTLCEAIKAHFNNSYGNAGPVVFINVLDPSTHKASTQTTVSLTFTNGKATITGDKIILDTLVLADKVEGTDYSVEYDIAAGKVILTAITTISSAVNATYYELDFTNVTKTTIIGEATAAGSYKGLGAVRLVYTELGLIPNIINAPKWSEDPDVYEAMVAAATKINGHWDAIVNADLPVGTTSDTIAEAIALKATNEMTSERSKVYWPQWRTNDGVIYHLSTLATWLMLQLDNEHDSVPMESCSNKRIPSGTQYFGASSTNAGFDQQTANQLNEKGITTAVFWGGINVLWGPHTAAYDYASVTDARVIFENSIRTMMHVTNSFQSDWGLYIDQPMTKALADTIRNKEQEKADALAAIGALMGEPVVEFIETDNPVGNLMQGDFVWSNRMTPTPPFKSGTLKVAYTDEGFTSYFEEV